MSAIGLTNSQIKQLISHLDDKWSDKRCPMCRENAWSVDGLNGVILSSQLRNLNLGGPMLPCAAMTCRNCGNTLFINLKIAGIIFEEDEGL